MPFVSSIFLRWLLCPGIYNPIALRATLLDYNRHWTDSEFQSLTADGLKKEILSLIEDQVLFAYSFGFWFRSNPSLSLSLVLSYVLFSLERGKGVGFGGL